MRWDVSISLNIVDQEIKVYSDDGRLLRPVFPVEDCFILIDEDTDDLLRNEMTVSVNVGIGATDPVKKIDRLLLGIRTMAEIDPHIINIIDQKEVSKEVFGALGYKDSQRFFSEDQGPVLEDLAARLEQMEQVLQQLTDQGAAKQIDAQAKIAVAQIKAQSDTQTAQTLSLIHI